jgi:hypothetical protein
MDQKIVSALDHIYSENNYDIISINAVGENFLVKIFPHGRDCYLCVSIGKYEHKDSYYVWNAMVEDLPLDRP